MRITREQALSSGRTIFYHAEDVRRERTGIHAKVMICLDKTLLTWTNFNVERDEDRTRLANSAYGHLGDVDGACWSKYEMKHALDLFCAGLWDQVVSSVSVGPMKGVGGDIPQDFVLEPYILRGGGSMVYAPPGRGKSYTAMLMAVSVDAGWDGLFSGVSRPRKGLYINIERDQRSMERRLHQVNKALGLDPERELDFLNARGKSLNDVIDSARRAVREYRTEVVFLDSISRAGFGDLTENSPVNKIIDALNGLCETWFALAHTPRADESHIYGSVHFEAGIDVGIQMTTETQDDGLTMGIGLKITKANDIRKPPRPFMFAMEFDDLGLANVRQARSREFGMLLASARTPIEEIREYLLQVGEATADEISSEIGKHRTEVSRMLSGDLSFHRRKAGKQVFWGVTSVVVDSP